GMTALSVSTSAISSPAETLSPSFLCHFTTFPSVIVSLNCGMVISAGMESRLLRDRRGIIGNDPSIVTARLCAATSENHRLAELAADHLKLPDVHRHVHRHHLSERSDRARKIFDLVRCRLGLVGIAQLLQPADRFFVHFAELLEQLGFGIKTTVLFRAFL